MNQQNKSSLLVALFTVISRVFGLLRISFISSYFGAGSGADILNLVLSIPNNLRKIFAEGGLSNAYMSVFGMTIQGSARRTLRSQKFFSELLFYVGTATLLITILLSVFSRPVSGVLFEWDSIAEANTAARLFSVLIFFLFFITISVIFSGLLQSHRQFGIVAISPILHSIFVIICILLFHRSLHVYAVGIGFIVGAALQVVLLAFPICFLGYAIVPRVSLRFSPEIKLVLRRYLPSVLSILLTVISQQVVFYLSSTLEVGASSTLAYAIVFWQLPIGVFINSINAVAFVYLVRAFENGDANGLHSCVQDTLRNLSFIVLPITALFYFFAHAGVSIVLQRGQLDADAAYTVSKIVQAYSIGLPLLAYYLFLQKLMYALLQHKRVLFYTCVFCCVDLLLSIFLIRTALGVQGIAYAYSISLLLIMPLMYSSVAQHINFKLFIKTLIKAGLAFLPLCAAAFLASKLTSELWFNGSSVLNISVFIALAAGSFLLMFTGYRIMGLRMLQVLRTRSRGRNN